MNGHTHPVEVFYLKEDEVPEVHVATIAMVGHIVRSSETGDLLIFSAGEAEIELLCTDIRKFWPDLSATIEFFAAPPIDPHAYRTARGRVMSLVV